MLKIIVVYINFIVITTIAYGASSPMSETAEGAFNSAVTLGSIL